MQTPTPRPEIAEHLKDVYNAIVMKLTALRKATPQTRFDTAELAHALVHHPEVSKNMDYLGDALHLAFDRRHGATKPFASKDAVSGTFSFAAAAEARHQRSLGIDDVIEAMGELKKKSPRALRMTSPEECLWGGIALLSAGLAAFGGFKQLSHASVQDETGKSQIQWSNVGLGLASAALAAGMAYVGYAKLRSGLHYGR